MLKVDEKNQVFLTRGDSAVLELSLTDGEGNPYDFSNDTVKFGLKRTAFESACVLEKTFDEEGKIKFSPEDTESLEFGDYVYDVQVEHTTESESEEEEDVVDIYTPIAAVKFSIGYNVL